VSENPSPPILFMTHESYITSYNSEVRSVAGEKEEEEGEEKLWSFLYDLHFFFIQS
jgi:hypothetical protein